MALTADQISLIRMNIGDDAVTPVFSEVELNLLADTATVAYPDLNLIDITTAYALRSLLGNRAKFADYVQNESEEKESQIFEQTLKLLQQWNEISGIGIGPLFLGAINLNLSTDTLASEDDWSSYYA